MNHLSPMSLALPFLLALGACGSQASDSDSNDSSNPDGSGGNTAQLDVSTLEGTYVGVYQTPQRNAAAEGWGEITVDSNGHAVINVAPGGSEAALAGESDITAEGGVAFSVAGTGTVDSYEVTYEGTLRLQGDNAFAWGDWASSSGATGFWGAYRNSNQYPLDASIPSICPAVMECVGADWMTTAEQCQAFVHCALGYVSANGAECYDEAAQSAEAFEGVESVEDCPEPSTDPAPATCRADPGVCEYVVRGI